MSFGFMDSFEKQTMNFTRQNTPLNMVINCDSGIYKNIPVSSNHDYICNSETQSINFVFFTISLKYHL